MSRVEPVGTSYVKVIVNVTDGLRSSQSNISAYMDLIGSKADGFVYDPENGDLIEVKGTVVSIQKGVYEDYAVMNGVEAEIASVITDETSADPDFITNYLAANKGGEVKIEIVDRTNDTRVPVSAVLKDYVISPDGAIKATLDGMNVPIERITGIELPVQE
jgi:flagellar basal-body rod modification protein FlgD